MKKCTSILVLLLTAALSAKALAADDSVTIPEADPVHKVEFSFGKSIITFSNGETAEYGNDYKALFINGSLIQSDVKTVNNYTLVPIRKLVETLGGSVEWIESTQTVIIHKDNLTIEMVIGSNNVTVDGVIKTTAVAPNLYDDYTYLPIRFVSETFGATVDYATGEYDTVNNVFINYPIVQGIQGNVIVDQFDINALAKSETDAVEAIKSLMNTSFTGFKTYYTSDHAGDYTNIFNLIQTNIDNTSVIAMVSRYYLLESAGLFLYDKYTGSIYSIGSSKNANWVRKYSPGQAENYQIFIDGYIELPS